VGLVVAVLVEKKELLQLMVLPIQAVVAVE
jgi:hypothetical protein